MNQEKIGELLKTLRKKNGKTQEEVARDLYVSQKTISRWESGESLPDISIICDVASYYGITVDELLNGAVNSKDNVITSNKKEIESKNIDIQETLKKINISMIISFSIFAISLLSAMIVLFATRNIAVPIVLSLFGIISSLLLFLISYKELRIKENNILETTNIKLIKEKKRYKLVSFLDLYSILTGVGLFLIHYAFFFRNQNTNFELGIYASNMVLIGVLLLSYFIIRPVIKNINFNKQLFLNKLPVLFLMFLLIPVIFFVQMEIITKTTNSTGYQIVLGPFLVFNYPSVYSIISIVLIFVSIILSIIFIFLKKNNLSFIFSTVSILSPVMNIISAKLLENNEIYTVNYKFDYIISLFSLLVAIAILVTYIVLKRHNKNNYTESL